MTTSAEDLAAAFLDRFRSGLDSADVKRCVARLYLNGQLETHTHAEVERVRRYVASVRRPSGAESVALSDAFVTIQREALSLAQAAARDAIASGLHHVH